MSDPIIAPEPKADAEVVKAPKQLAFDDEDGPLKDAHGDYIEGPQEVEDGN